MMETRKTSSQTDRTTDMEGDFIQLEVLTSGGIPYKPENSNPSNCVKFEGMKWIPSGDQEQQPKWSTSAETPTFPCPKGTATEATNIQARTLERSVRDNITFSDQNMQVYKLEKSKDNSGILDTRPETSHLNLVQGQQSVINEMSPRLVYMIPQSSSDTVGNVNFVLPKADVVKETVTYQSKLEKAVTKAGRRKQRKSSVQLPGVSAISSSIVNTSPIINTSPMIATSVHGPIPIQEGDPRLLGGTTQPNSGPLFIAVPLSNLAVDLKNTNSNTEGINTSITTQKYQELISTAFTTETQNSSRRDTGQDDGNHAPVLQAQTQADINSSIGYSNEDRSTGISSELKRQFEMAFNPRLSSFPKPDQVAKVEEKTYEDEGLSHTILKAMWHMIEADLFWDGILYIGKHHIKLHKLVMASISSVVHAKILSSNEPVLKIKLPVDLDHTVVRSFVKYLYHGTISITTNNVRDLYRMSTIFELEKLKKYCYDFCKLTKLAHIIINSPQEDSMKAVQFGEVENKQDEPEITNIVDEIANETNDLIDNIDLEASEITLGLRKAEDKKQEPVFDWLGIDEDQSNIPIRKRGRTRKGILKNNNVAFKTIINTGETISANNLNDKIVKEPYANSQGVNENRIEEATIIIANVRSIGERNEGSKVQNDTEEASINQTVSKNIVEAMDQENSLLPDPFDGGKFDESKLTKKTVQPRTMVTRYRGKNKNILEAATNKKARLDEGEQKHLEVEEHSSIKSEKTPSRRPRAVNKRKQDDSIELSPETAQEKENIVIPTESPNTEADPTSPQQLLKKTRPKRSTSEQESPQKKETPMRPPPKKRTKEIREMMRSVDKSSQNPFVETLIKDELTAMKKQEKKKRTVNPGHLCLPKTKLLVEKILEIDEKGSDIVGDRMYRCEFCGNEYICAKRILTHVVKTHDILLDETADHISVLKKNLSPKVCDVCGYKAKDANIYYIHFHKYFRHGVPLPQGWKPFKCDFCGKEFFTKFQLKDHKLTHFEETPFVCEHCGNGFKTRTCLNSHVFHKHSTVKRHKCPECVKTFKTHTQMIVHTRTHSGEKPFGCPHCIYRSTTRGNLRLHLANRHKFETEYITNIMKEVKAIDTGTAPSIDEDGNVIRLKESGFAVKLGQVDGEVLQIDPAGSSETRSMDTLADVASSKASDDSRNLRNETANEQPVQNETLMSGVDAAKTFENQYSQVSFDDVKAVSVGHQEIHSLQEGDFLDVSRPLHLVISNNVENSLEMQVVTSEYAGGSYRADDSTITAPTESKPIHDIRNVPNAELQTQESRMIVRDILHQLDVRPQIDSRSLLKAALMQGPDQNLDNRGVADAQIIQVPESFFQEGTNLVAEQIGDNLLSVPNQYADSNRLQSYDTSRNVTAEPLQLVINTANLQSKSEQQTVQRYHNLIQAPQPYSDGCAVKSHQSEIPTIISEEMQQAEQLEDQAQAIGTNQPYEGTSQPHAESHLSEEQVLMYQNYYQQNCHHGYQ